MTGRQSTDYVAMGKDMGLEGKELAKFVKEQMEAVKGRCRSKDIMSS